MIADHTSNVQAGAFDREIHLASTAKLELVDFIAQELPRWRDHPQRQSVQAETSLTEQLCDHLNSATYESEIWSHVQFRTETGDETLAGRKIDLTVKARAATLIIENRRHSQFDALFPIECKRLPTPREKDRDEREYVITTPGTTGGIQRFKFGLHGATHRFAAMIGYVQDQAFAHWFDQVNGWIRDLAAESNSSWTDLDFLKQFDDDSIQGVCSLASRHHRPGELNECQLRHLWIKMN